MANDFAARLGKDPKNYIAKSFRRSAATQLAEAGMPVVGLQIAGNWKGVATQLERMEHSNKSCNDRMSMLDGEEEESPAKNQKHVKNENDVSSTSKVKGGGVVQNNYTFINIVRSAGVSIGDALHNSGVVKEDE